MRNLHVCWFTENLQHLCVQISVISICSTSHGHGYLQESVRHDDI
jgi:hypothetical protein